MHAAAYLVLAWAWGCGEGLVNRESSSFGFTTTLSMVIIMSVFVTLYFSLNNEGNYQSTHVLVVPQINPNRPHLAIHAAGRALYLDI